MKIYALQLYYFTTFVNLITRPLKANMDLNRRQYYCLCLLRRIPRNSLNCHSHLALRVLNKRLIAKELIHSLEGLAFCFRKKDNVAYSGDKIPREEEVEKAKPKGFQRNGSALRKDQVERPVRNSGEGVPPRADLRWKYLDRV